LTAGDPIARFAGMAHTAVAAADIGSTVDSSRRPAPFGAPYVFALFVIDGNDPSLVHRLVRPLTVVGRGEENHFPIEDDKVSKEHCTIRVEGPVCSIIDPGSRNGTSVNGRRLAPNVAQCLRNLDEIQIGGHRLLLLTGRFRDQRKNHSL
jgi:pSer/pThr/pTyr-binding forkhead associated (FHA) protein